MFRRASVLFTVAAFAVFSASCTMWPTREIRTEADYPSQGRQVASVVKTDGEIVEFTKSHPGIIRRDAVEGAARVLVKGRVEIRGPFALIKKRADGTISEVTDAIGKVHYVQSVLNEGPDVMTIQESSSEVRTVSIPLSDVRLVKYKKANVVLTLMALAAGGAVGLMALVVYSFSLE